MTETCLPHFSILQLVPKIRPGRRSCLQPSSDTHLRNLILSATTSSSYALRAACRESLYLDTTAPEELLVGTRNGPSLHANSFLQ
ncbi:hypothetical protein AK812_SmicGene45325, partial [Symbiodinium microadriaticum]